MQILARNLIMKKKKKKKKKKQNRLQFILEKRIFCRDNSQALASKTKLFS